MCAVQYIHNQLNFASHSSQSGLRESLTQMLQAVVSDGDAASIDGLQPHAVTGLSRHAVIVCRPRLVRPKLDRAAETEYPLRCRSVWPHVSNTAVVNSTHRDTRDLTCLLGGSNSAVQSHSRGGASSRVVGRLHDDETITC